MNVACLQTTCRRRNRDEAPQCRGGIGTVRLFLGTPRRPHPVNDAHRRLLKMASVQVKVSGIAWKIKSMKMLGRSSIGVGRCQGREPVLGQEWERQRKQQWLDLSTRGAGRRRFLVFLWRFMLFSLSDSFAGQYYRSHTDLRSPDDQ